MKNIIILSSIFVLTSCTTSWSQDHSWSTTWTGTEAHLQSPVSYYDELRNRCASLSQDQVGWCNSSVTIMEKGWFKEVDYDKDGNTLPCSEGMTKNTIRSYGSLNWCEPLAQ